MYIFKKTKDPNNEFSKSNITIEILNDDISLDELFDEFVYFLRGCSFSAEAIERYFKLGESDE